MAQPMTGPESTPVVRSDEPISIFKQERKAGTKMAKQQTTATPATEQTEIPAEQAPVSDLAGLLAAKRALDEQIKAAKEALPKLTKLEEVLAQQAEHPRHTITLQRIQARVRAGQPRDEAVVAVIGQVREWCVEQLAAE